MICICTHSPRGHEPHGEGACTALVSGERCKCFKYREADTAEAIAKFDEQSELYIKLHHMEPISRAIQ